MFADVEELRKDLDYHMKDGGIGVSVPFTLEKDDEGNLYAVYSDDTDINEFEVDSNGNVYVILKD